MMHRLSPFAQAAVLALTGYLLFSMADISAKILSARYPIALCIFLPAAIAATGIGARIIYERGLAGFQTSYLKPHLLRGAIITGLVVGCVNSLKLIPIADFYCIIFLSPFVVMLMSVLAFKEPVHLPRILVLALSFIGVIIAIGPHFDSFNIGYLYASAVVVFGSLNVFLVRKIGHEEYSPLFGFFPVMGVAICSLPFAVPHFTADIPFKDGALFLFYGIVLIGAHTILPMAFTRTPSVSSLTPLHYSQMIWGILAGIFIFDAPVEMTTLLGGGLIILSGVGLFLYERIGRRILRIYKGLEKHFKS